MVEGDKVKFTMGGQTLIYTIGKDGCLDGGAGAMGIENKLYKK